MGDAHTDLDKETKDYWESPEGQRKEFRQSQMLRIKKKSGNVSSDSHLVSFLYELLRDHLPASTVEEIVLNSTGPNTEKTNFCNGYLAKYAQDLADRLTTK